MSKIIKVIDNELIEIASYRNPEIIFHDANNPIHIEPEYDNFESYCDYKEVINPFVLTKENKELQRKIDKAIEYIEDNELSYSDNDFKVYQMSSREIEKLLDILKGEENEE